MKTQSLTITGLLVSLTLGLVVRPAHSQEHHDNVVIVLDASGSMRERMTGTDTSKMEAAKAALKEVLRRVPESTHIGLLQFSSKDIRENWLYPLGPRNEEELLKAIERPQPGEGTPLGAYIKIGADRLLEERAAQFGYGTYRLLIVTDGEASDRKLVDRYTPDVVSRGLIVDVIGVDMKQDHTLAKQAHSYRRANDPESLKTAVAAVFAEVAKSGTDSVGEDAFETIAGLPNEIAAVALQTLSTSGNHLIGSRPFAEVGSKPEAQPAVAKRNIPVPSSPPLSQGKPRNWTTIIVIVIGGLVALSILKGIFRGGR